MGKIVIFYSHNFKSRAAFLKKSPNTFRILKGFSLSFLLILLISSCAASKLDLSLDYYKGPDNSFEKSCGLTIGVDEFIDMRPQSITSDERKWLGFIPGVLWIDFISEVPDISTGFTEYNSKSFTLAFSRAIYNHIERTGIFKKAVFLPIDRYADIDYRLEGILERTFLKETGYYYGSGFYAWMTRILGLPYVSFELSVFLTLRLRRMDTNEVIWTYTIEGNRTDKYYNIYELTKGKENKHILSYNLSKILEGQMPQCLESLRKAI
ncbi:MAG: hypothetical protein ACMUIU_08425 [bacterium]